MVDVNETIMMLCEDVFQTKVSVSGLPSNLKNIAASQCTSPVSVTHSFTQSQVCDVVCVCVCVCVCVLPVSKATVLVIFETTGPQKQMKKLVIPIEECEKAIRQGLPVLEWEGMSIRVDQLAPELALASIQVYKGVI